MLEALHNSENMTVKIGSEWLNGRAAYGGLVASLAVAGMSKIMPEQKQIRSLLVNFVGLVPSERVTIEPTILRAGKSVTQAVCDVVLDGSILAHTSAAFGVDRKGIAAPSNAAFNPAARDTVPLLKEGVPFLPGFLKNFDIHWTGGGIPLSGTKDRMLSLWARPKEDMSSHPAARVIAVADLPPPVMMSHYTKPVNVCSLSWALEFVCAPEDIETDWFYLEYTLEAASGGYTQQSGRIFDEHGNLCAISRQTMLYFE